MNNTQMPRELCHITDKPQYGVETAMTVR